jgi:hypothetical protein
MVKLRAASVNSNDISIGNGVPGVKIGFPHITRGAGKGGRLVTCGNQRGRESSDRRPADILGLPKSFRLDLRNARGLHAGA